MSSIDNTCYGMHESKITHILIDLPCGIPNSTNPHVTCCVNGDYCLSNSLCTHIAPDGSHNYYNADCTDPTLEDPICGTRCGMPTPGSKWGDRQLTEHLGGQGLSDLTYNETTGFWACCWNKDSHKVECDNPSKEIYPAPAPSDLATIQYLPKTESGTPTYAIAATTAAKTTTEAESEKTSASAPTSASATATEATVGDSPSTSTKSSSGVSAGVAAGIGVGVAAGIVIIAAIAIFIFFRRRTSKRGSFTPHGGYNASAMDQQVGLRAASLPGKGVMRQSTHELGNNPIRIAELDVR